MKTGGWRRRLRVVWAVAALAGLAAAACRTAPPEPITVSAGAIVVANLTTDDWQNVEVWLNDHYRVTKSRLVQGERFTIPLSSFVAGFGQRFDAARQPVRGVGVAAKTTGGHAVTLVWGAGRRR